MTDHSNWGYFSDGTIHLICSSHNDIAWFDTPAAIIAWRDEKSITPALEHMAGHKAVRFSMENVLYLLEYLERHPERKDEIHQLMLEKRFDWGATYNQPYESLLTGEQLVRQAYLGRKLVKKLMPGADARVYYSPDVPGRAMQMPQILAKAGIPYMLISRHKPSVQYWYSPAGSRVVELEGKDTDASLRLDFPLQSAEHTNLIEEEGQSLPVDDGSLNVRVGHHAIETFRLSQAK